MTRSDFFRVVADFTCILFTLGPAIYINVVAIFRLVSRGVGVFAARYNATHRVKGKILAIFLDKFSSFQENDGVSHLIRNRQRCIFESETKELG